MKTLIVVDMQNDFVGGSLGSPEVKGIVGKVKEKVQEYLTNGDQVIFTRDTHDVNYLSTNEGKYLPVEHCLRGSQGWEIIEELDASGCKCIDKETFGFMGWSDIELGSEVELVGVCTDICVISNALIIKAQFPESDITVDATCCAGVTPETHKAALVSMKSCQINVVGENGL